MGIARKRKKHTFANMDFSGIIVGATVLFCIGICHLAVIKMEK